SAGAPILADQDVEDYLTLPEDYAGAEDHFALRVQGDSMVGAGILDGDVVVVRRGDDARDGEIVAALVPGPAEDEATVKRFHLDGGRPLLLAENPAYAPIEFGGGRVLGR